MLTVPPEVRLYGIGEEDWKATPLSVKGTVRILLTQVQSLGNELKTLRDENASLLEKVKQNSTNSSKPPSSDLPHTPKKAHGTGKKNDRPRKKQGAQEGHEGHGRELIPQKDVSNLIPCKPVEQCTCGGKIIAEDTPCERHQKYDLPRVSFIVYEWQIFGGTCETCGAYHVGALPQDLPEGLLMPYAMAQFAQLTGKYHLSRRMVQELMAEWHGLEVSIGTISNNEERVSQALAEPVEEAKQEVQKSTAVNMDETSHRDQGERGWLWVAVTQHIAVYSIRFSRAAAVAKELLGESFAGILISDRYSGYNWMSPERRQVCWAHLLRDFLKIAEREGAIGYYGYHLLAYAEEMFHLWHHYKGGYLERAQFEYGILRIRAGVEDLLKKGSMCGHGPTMRTCLQILKVKEALWTFTHTAGIAPTNNRAEQWLRAYVIWRKLSFGTQSERGQRFVERMMTVIASCAIQKRRALTFMVEAIEAYYGNRPKPSLMLKETELKVKPLSSAKDPEEKRAAA